MTITQKEKWITNIQASADAISNVLGWETVRAVLKR